MVGVVAALLLASCSNNTYTIGGTVEDPSLEGSKVYKIERYDTGEMVSNAMSTLEQYMDSTLVADGKFSFTGKIDSPDYCTIYIPSSDPENGPYIYQAVVIEPGVTTRVEALGNRSSRVSGSAFNDALQQNLDAYSDAMNRFYAMYDKMQDGTATEADMETIDKIREEMQDIDFQFVKNNINNPGAWSKLYNAAVMAGTLEKQKELIAGASGKTLELEDYKGIVERIEKLEKTAEGQPFTDLAFEDPDGNIMHLSDYAGKGKYILVDFWASWCGPCKAEMPNVVKCYHQYKDKGFDIVSISLDTKKENWVKAIDEWGMPWHHMSDLKGWGSEGAAIYAVTGVPHAMLLGPDGTILARGLYGEELYAKLAEVMP